MADTNYWKRRASRRTLLGASAAGSAGLAALGLVGCGDDDDKGSATAKPSGGVLNQTATVAPSASASAVADKPVKGGTYVFNSLTSIQDVWDPHFSVSTASHMWAFIGNLMLRPSVDGKKIEGELVEKYEQPSDTEYVFTVRQDVKWHNRPPSNGRAMTADDIAFSLNRIAGKAPFTKAGQRASSLAGLELATATDAKTVRIKMAAPNSGFIGGVAEWRNQAVAKDYVEGGGDFKDPTKIPGTGGFMNEKHEDLKESLYSRHPNYWEKDKPYLDGVRRVYIADRLAQLSAFVKGDIHMLEAPNKAEEKTVPDQTKNFREEAWISGTWYHFRYNTTLKAFSDARVRKAIQLVLDIAKIHDAVFGKGRWDYCGPVPSVFPEGIQPDELVKLSGFNPSTKDADIKKAKELMTAAGFADGNITFKILSPDNVIEWYDLALRAADALKSVWPAMKIELEVAGDLTTFLTRSTKGEFDMTSYRFAVAPDAYPEAVVSFHSNPAKGTRNYGKFSDPKIDAFLDKAITQLKFEERRQTFVDMQKVLMEESMPLIPLDVYKYLTYFSTKVGGMQGYGSKLGANTDDTKKHIKDAWLKA